MLAGCSAEKPKAPVKSSPEKATEELVRRLDHALAAAAQFLVSKQSDDGAWRSPVYGCFRDGPELTPHVLSCLYFLPQGGESVRPAFFVRARVDGLPRCVNG